MKKFFLTKILLLLILTNLIILGVCAAQPGSPTQNPVITDVRTLFPTQLGLTWTFEGTGNEYAGFIRTVMYQKDNLVQLVDANSGTRIGKVFRVTGESLVQVFSTEEFYSDKVLFNEKPNRQQVLLKTPLIAGTVWQDDQEKREIVSADEKVQVPAGSFQNVIKVKITPLSPKPANEQYEYYVAGTGLIMREFISDDYVITSKLKSFAASAPNNGATIIETSTEQAKLAGNITAVYAEPRPNAELENTIIKTLNIPDEYLSKTKYYYNYVDLNMDGADEIFVVVMGPYTSGTGGSTALHIIQTNEGMQVNQVFTLMRTPIIVSDKVTKGVKELVVRYSGGGAEGKYVVLTCSDGYFTNVNEGRVIEGLEGISGKAIISNDLLKDIEEGKALFLRKK